MRKKVLLAICFFAGLTLGADEYTIQTISAFKENSITPAFEKKVQKSALEPVKLKEGSCNIVTVGHFKSVKEAQKEIGKAKKIASDAFVRPLIRNTPHVCEGNQTVITSKPGMEVGTSKANTPAAGTALNTETKTISMQTPVSAAPAAAGSECDKPSATTVASVYLYDRNLARKSDIHEAIEYYKNSPYYSFKPMGLPR